MKIKGKECIEKWTHLTKENRETFEGFKYKLKRNPDKILNRPKKTRNIPGGRNYFSWSDGQMRLSAFLLL